MSTHTCRRPLAIQFRGRNGKTKWDTGRGSASSQGSFWHGFKDLNFKPGPPGTCEGVFGRIVVWDLY